MKKVFAALAAPFLATTLIASSANADEDAFCPTADDISPYDVVRDLNNQTGPERDATVEAMTIALAGEALDHAFGKNPSMQQTENILRDFLTQIPGASDAERQRIHEQAYAIRLQLERDNYQYYMVQAAQAVAMAAQPASLGGDRAWTSLYETAGAYSSVLIYDYGRYKNSDQKKTMEQLVEEARDVGINNPRTFSKFLLATDIGRQKAVNERRETYAGIVRGLNNCPN